MPHAIVRQKVGDYAHWKAAYDAHLGARQHAGLTEKLLLRNQENPHEVFIVFEAADLKKAQSFAVSSDLREVMMKAGVVDKPDIWFFS